MSLNKQTTRITDAVLNEAIRRLDNNCNYLNVSPIRDYDLAWTADTTVPVIGNGASAGRYLLAGGMCYAEGVITIGSTGVTLGSGAYSVDLPRPALSLYTVGQCHLYDASTGFSYPGVTLMRADRTGINFRLNGVLPWAAAVPIALAVGDEMRFSLWYPWQVG